MIGPAGLPKLIVDQLSLQAKAALETQKVKEYFATQCVTIIGSDPATAEKFFQADLEKHQNLVTASGAKLE
ncbi:hypothetical protein IC232_25350 [Microvirga sp. BT688]|uniref:tripartite tricarboxylate transporter substrate-binding protein n=1 Tax=Microvirga sp. TaxID=1873136 RepID=UPI0016859F60|nr:tripartite tricarboxylate transporter substrate-binding protein [Microvirga sp.]MBD2750001.1 hypothetical protein [Microvirga sp.]